MLKRELPIPANRSFFLFGPRQTGKTTLIKGFVEKSEVLEINLLDAKLYTQYAVSPACYLKK